MHHILYLKISLFIILILKMSVVKLTPIDEVPGYEPGGFVEIFSTIQFSTDCDVTVGAGRVTSYSNNVEDRV